MNKKIIIKISFNTAGFNKQNELDKKWIKYRLDIFKKYTLKSLINQTNQFFIAVLIVRDETLGFIINELKGKLPENVIIVGNNYNISIMRYIQNYDYLYLVRLDSDDCYEENFIDLLHNYPTKKDTEVLINQYSYDYDTVNNRLTKYWRESPPSYTFIYKAEDYKKGKRYKLKKGHCGAILLRHEILKGYNHLVTIHKKNTITEYRSYNHGSRKNVLEIEGQGITNILNRFGINENTIFKIL